MEGQEQQQTQEQPSLIDLMSGVKPGAPDLNDVIIKTAEETKAEEEAAAAATAAKAAAAAAAPKTPKEEAAEKAEAERLAAEAENTETYSLSPEEFYETLDEFYGEDINSNIEYGETNPMSPEGVFKREQYLKDKGIQEFADSLKDNDPRAYSYFLHRSNGGSDDDFFSSRSFAIPDLQTLEQDVDLQRNFYERVLLNRGNSPKQAEALIKMAIDGGELLGEAQEAYKIFKANETQQAKEVEETNKAKQVQKNTHLKEIGDAINTVIESNSALKFIIPKNQKEQFSTAFRQNIHYENGNFFIVKPLSKENLNQVMDAELFSYLKGDVSKLVKKQATTVATERTLTRLKDKQKAPAATSAPEAGKALREILPSN